MREVQQKIDTMILHLGGYWRPLSGLARLLEEVGEVGGAMRKGTADELQEELLDVLVISTCLANQYAITLSQPIVSTRKETRKELYFQIVEEAGEVARILNAYEGDKKLKANRQGESLQLHIEQLQSAVISLGERCDYDLFDSLYALIEDKSKRDFGRFDHTPDPISEESVRSYLKYQSGRYWGGIDPKPFETIDRYIRRESHLLRFLKIAPYEGLDGFVIKLNRNGMIFKNLQNDFQLPSHFEVKIESFDCQKFIVIRPSSQ